MKVVAHIFTLLASLLLGMPAYAGSLCPEFSLTQPVQPPLTDNEIDLVCGFKSGAQGAFKAWKTIPTHQGLMALRAFLEGRGYLRPIVRTANDHVSVDPGQITHLTSIEVSRDLKDLIDPSRKRKLIGEKLTPNLLSQLEAWSAKELQKRGYPCPIIKASADAETGQVRLGGVTGEYQAIGEIHPSGGATLNPQILARTYAFAPEQPYNRQALEVSAQRAIQEGLVERAYFTPRCTEERQPTYETIELGGQRLVLVQLGASTEDIFNLRLNWRYTRLPPNDSPLGASLHLSARLQEINAFYRLHTFQPPSKQWLEPLVLMRRQDETPFEVRTEQARLFYGFDWDLSDGIGFRVQAGPKYSVYHTVKGPGPGEARALSLAASLSMESHSLELYKASPVQGWRGEVNWERSDANFESTFSASSFSVSLERFENVGDFDPPYMILVGRGRFSTTQSDMREQLPPMFRHFLGGQDSLRGFDRLELNGGGSDRLTSALASFEVRPNWWSEISYPYFFVDAGFLGKESFSLDSPLYWSPGIGVEYRYRYGPLRAYLSHGFASGGERDDPPEHWQFYASWGEAF